MNDAGRPLEGRRIAIPETRELDLLAQMLEAKGAVSLRVPLVAIHDVPDAGPVLRWIDDLISKRFSDVVLYTGEGVRRLTGFADRAARREAFIDALGKARKLTRGPKPVRALRELGLDTDLRAAFPTTAGIIQTLSQRDVRDRPIGVQFYGREANADLMHFLDQAGAVVFPVFPYMYASKSEEEAVISLLEEIAQGRVDLITFTSSSQVDRLSDVARKAYPDRPLSNLMSQTCVAAVGPVVADSLGALGVAVRVVPEKSFFLRPMVNAIVEAVASPTRPA